MSNVENIARAIIQEKGRILLCRGKGKKNWFFPGGHIDEGESVPAALVREIREELGEESEVRAFLGASENKFEINGETTHEINLVFDVTLVNDGERASKEDHLEFSWFTREEIEDIIVFPLSLRDAVLASKFPLWASEGF